MKMERRREDEGDSIYEALLTFIAAQVLRGMPPIDHFRVTAEVREDILRVNESLLREGRSPRDLRKTSSDRPHPRKKNYFNR